MTDITLEMRIKIARIKKAERRAAELEELLDKVKDRDTREELIREIYQVWQSTQHYYDKLGLEGFIYYIVHDMYTPKH